MAASMLLCPWRFTRAKNTIMTHFFEIFRLRWCRNEDILLYKRDRRLFSGFGEIRLLQVACVECKKGNQNFVNDYDRPALCRVTVSIPRPHISMLGHARTATSRAVHLSARVSMYHVQWVSKPCPNRRRTPTFLPSTIYVCFAFAAV